MIAEVFDRRQLARYVQALKDQLDAPELADPARRAAAVFSGSGDPPAKLRAAIPSVNPGLAASGGAASDKVPFLANDPTVSLLQSALERKLREQGVHDETPAHPGLLSRIIHTAESLLHPVRFGPSDADWVLEVGGAMLERLAQGNHDFNPLPATHEISDSARVVVVGDWGSGLPRARAVAGFMAQEVAEALGQGREAHVVHLGDVYYSGEPEEVDRHVLAPGLWPVTVEQARAGVTSWSLNGNHDMYSGGFGLFEHLLVDERFSAQRSQDGRTTSFFRLRSPGWDFVALDTAWDQDVLSQGHVGVLEDPQAQFVAEVAAESDRRLVLLSHHQLISVYDTPDLGPTLRSKLAPVLDRGRVTGWLWGHEHRCMGFHATNGVQFPRCIGNGGVPVLMTHGPDDPIPPPGAWEQRSYLEYEGDHWARFGFAVLDLTPERITVRYRDDQGAEAHDAEVIL